MSLREAMDILRDDARARGMPVLAVAYGWSVIRCLSEEIMAQRKWRIEQSGERQ